MIFLILITALVADRFLGELNDYHPLVGFGNLANRFEKLCNNKPDSLRSILIGGIGVLILVIPFVFICFLLTSHLTQSWWIDIIVLYWAIGHQSLREHVNVVKKHLSQGQLSEAKQSLSMIVSRQTDELDQTQVVQATIETGLENGSDATFAPIFWFFVLGAPAVVAYRLCNTLDAMWGYRNERFNYFGCIAARCDDILNYIPARLVALSYALLGNTKNALSCWKNQSKSLNSPNAGPVMTSGAGSLTITLGGPAYYHGKLMQKPLFGSDKPPEITDIDRSLKLLTKTLIAWCLVIALTELVIFYL